MIISDTKGNTITLKRHKKLPSFAETGKKINIKLDGKAQAFILHPTKPTSRRVSLIINGVRYYKDDENFKAAVLKLKGAAFKVVANAVRKPSKAAKAATKGNPKGGSRKAPKQPKTAKAAHKLTPEATCGKCKKQPAIYVGPKNQPRCKGCGSN